MDKVPFGLLSTPPQSSSSPSPGFSWRCLLIWLNGILCEIFSHPSTGCVGVLDKIFMKTPSQVICLISILHNVKIERAAVKGWGLTASMRRLHQHKNHAVLLDRLLAPCARGAGGREKPWKWGTAFTLFCSFPPFHPSLHLSAPSSYSMHLSASCSYSICSLSLLPLGWLPLSAAPPARPSFIISTCHFFFSFAGTGPPPGLYSLTCAAYLQAQQDSQTFLGTALRTRSHL